MDRDFARYLMDKAKRDYNLISKEFSNTRSFLWPEIAVLGEYAKDGDKILDLGCGNGRLYDLFRRKNVEYSGVDNSEKLIEIAKKRNPGKDFRTADVLNLPYEVEYFDKIFSIAVLHHIPSEDLRRQFIRESMRVLKSGGLLIITVWNLWGSLDSLKRILKFCLLKIFGKSKLDFKDIFVPWQNKVLRYIHCFTKNELKKLVEGEGFKIKEAGILKREGTKNQNLYIVAEKI